MWVSLGVMLHCVLPHVVVRCLVFSLAERTKESGEIERRKEENLEIWGYLEHTASLVLLVRTCRLAINVAVMLTSPPNNRISYIPSSLEGLRVGEVWI
jgi:hypothetical protein